jgi:DNA polymerase epsilon subunit 2
MRFFTQEIVIFRDDLLKKMQRHVVIAPNLSEGSPELVEQLVKTILDQGHLCPLPAHARPIHWELDHAMRLFPLPHLVSLMSDAKCPDSLMNNE